MIVSTVTHVNLWIFVSPIKDCQDEEEKKKNNNNDAIIGWHLVGICQDFLNFSMQHVLHFCVFSL